MDTHDWMILITDIITFICLSISGILLIRKNKDE